MEIGEKMTKEEIYEFLEENGIYRLSTNTGDIVGKVIKLGTTSLIIQRINGKKKMVAYEVINEIDEENGETNLECLSTQKQMAVVQQPMEIQSINVQETQSLAITSRLTQTISGMLQEIKYDKTKLKKQFKEYPEVRSKWADTYSMFNDAIKNHAFPEKYTQIMKNCTELFKRFPKCLPLYCFTGIVLSEKGDFEQACLYFYSGNDCYNEAVCAMKSGNIGRAIVAFAEYINEEDSEIHLSETENEELRKLLIKLEQMNITRKGVDGKSVEKTKNIAIETTQDEGQITLFKTIEKYGFIGGNIYFYITQVEDYELRKALLEGRGLLTTVTFTYGVSIQGTKAADHIVAAEPIKGQLKEEENQVFTGFISIYNRFWVTLKNGVEFPPDSGEVTRNSDNKTFTFYPEAICDPMLKAEIENNYNSEGMDVAFQLQFRNDKYCIGRMGKLEYASQLEKEIKKQWEIVIPDYVELEKWKEQQNIIQETDLKTVIEQEMSGKRDIVYRMFYPENEKNPFLHIERMYGCGNDFQQGCHYMTGYRGEDGNQHGIDLESAERCFVRAICANDNKESAISNLVSVYLRRGGAYIVKGLKLLEACGIEFHQEKLLDMQIQLIDKSGNFEAFVWILKEAIRYNSKPNKVVHYQMRLLSAYYGEKKYVETLREANVSLNYIRTHRYMFKNDSERYKFNESRVLRIMALAYYQQDNLEQARQIAGEILKNNPSDIVAQQIQNNTLQNVDMSLDEADKNYSEELELVTEHEGELSEFSNYLLKQIHLSTIFSKMKRVYSNIRDDRYIGKTKDADKDLQDIRDNLNRNIAVSLEPRSEFQLGMALIALHSRENDPDNENRISLENVKNYVGRGMALKADNCILSGGQIDVARHYYISALQYLRKGDTANINNSMNRLVYSFFLSKDQLKETFRDTKRNPQIQISQYFNKKCLSIKDILLSTFLLEKSGNFSTMIRSALYEDELLRQAVVDCCKRFLQKEVWIDDSYRFERLCEEVEQRYFQLDIQLKRGVSDCANEYNMTEKLQQHTIKLKKLVKIQFLFNLDEMYLDRYIDLVEEFSQVEDIYSVADREDSYRSLIGKWETLVDDISENPTELSFDLVRKHSEEFYYITRERLSELYASSKPEISEISLLSDSVYVNDDTVSLTICFANSKFKQTADGVEVEISSSHAGVRMDECTRRISSIPSGERREYIFSLKLSRDIIYEKQFDIDVTLAYKYHPDIDTIAKESKIEKMNVNLNSKESFVPIENMYEKIARSSGVAIPEMFKGRNQLIDKICRSMYLGNGIMNKNRGIILWGQRRIGKNSVKDYLKKRIYETYPDAYMPIELGSIGKSHNLKEVLAGLAFDTESVILTDYEELYDDYVKAGLEDSSIKIENSEDYMLEFRNFMSRFSALLKRKYKSETHIPLYYIDEFSYLYEWIEKGELDGKEFMRFWKSFIQDYGICAIIIAQDNIPVWKAQYENEFSCMNYDNEITYLMPDGAKELICDPCRLNGESRFSPEAVDYIYSLTRGSAFLIVILCKSIIDYLNQNYTEKVTKAVVEIVLEKEFIANRGIFEPQDFEPQIVDVSKVNHEADEMIKANTRLLKEIAAKTVTAVKTPISELLFLRDGNIEYCKEIFERLKERKIINTEGNTYCSITMPLLKFHFLREQGLMNREALNYV